MKRILFCLLLSGLYITSFAQDNRTIIEIDGKPITVEDFLAIYNKNNTNNVVDKKTMEEYVDLFINFKLKVKEAESLGMDTVAKFVNELAGYRRQLAQPYLVDKAMTDQLIEEAYDRMNLDIAAYHILVKVDDNAAPIDTVNALKKIKAFAKDIKTEADMLKTIAKIKSSNNDKVIAEDLGYFTAFSMVYPFENAAYNTDPGKLSAPIRTRFGYHVIFVKDKRPARGEIRVSHIMTKSTNDMSPEKREMAKKRIDEIYNQLNQGADFKTLAQQYSEDQGTANKGGLLPWFGTGRMVEEFENAAFSLNLNGEFSAPIQTAYGWHIIKREDYHGIGSFDEQKATIKKKIEKDSRGQMGRASLVSKLKSEYSLTYNLKNRDAINRTVNYDYLKGKWNPSENVISEDPVLSITDNLYSNRSVQYSKTDFFNFLKQNQPRKPLESLLSIVLDEKWNEFVEIKLIDFENQNLEAKYPEFKALMQEYHDGILLFDLMDKKVWSKAVKDTVGLKNYYENHQNEFMWAERVNARVFTCLNQKVSEQTQKILKKNSKKGISNAELLRLINESNALNLSIEEGIYSKGDNQIIDTTPWAVGTHNLGEVDGKVAFVIISEVLAPQPKRLDEARGLVTSAYQNQLEADWIAELRSKYTFTINQEIFNTINH